jgi:hypothetical protein
MSVDLQRNHSCAVDLQNDFMELFKYTLALLLEEHLLLSFKYTMFFFAQSVIKSCIIHAGANFSVGN